jgi:alpha-N-arabinofuranosidase
MITKSVWRELCSLAAVVLGIVIVALPAKAEEASVVAKIGLDKPGAVVNRNIYGHFAEHLGRCIYEGIWVGENSAIPNTRGIRNDVAEALRELKIPVLRWPGGCFADEYHWMDGIGPRHERPKIINTHWGGVVENNHFGTHEFLDLCEQIGAAPYVCGNVGSGSVQEMMQWVEYMTSDADSPMANLRRANGREEPWKVRYFGVGNESWGCGGSMRPEYYADLYRRYNTFVKNYSGNQIFRIACGPNSSDYRWTEVLMREASRRMNGLSLHYYTIATGDWGRKGSATEFGEDLWHATLRRTLVMEELISKHSEIMDRFDKGKRVKLIVDEWGTWYDVEPGTNPGFLYQQNTLRDALVAALNFHIFHRHADRVAMANIAQTINVLQAMILTDGAKMVKTPTYHTFEMFKVHQDATLLPVELKTVDYVHNDEAMPAVSVSATRNSEGVIHVSFVNVNPQTDIPITCKLAGMKSGRVTGRVLTGSRMNAHNTFDSGDEVAPTALTSVELSGGTLNLSLPAKSVVVVEVRQE